MKKAFCVGINAYAEKPLNGCVNDANDWAELLIAHFDFPRSAITLLTDKDATKRAIVEGLEGLLAGAKKGDVLVFTNSSHGAQVRDGGDRDEPVDEAICPVDYQNGFLIDDELRELFSGLGADVHLAVVADSCHSGSVTRAPGETTYAPDYSTRARFLDWSLLPERFRPEATAKRKKSYPEEGMREILLAGAADIESSYDAPFAGRFRGVLTNYALQAIREGGYRVTYENLAARIRELFSKTKFAGLQHPQLEGAPETKARQIFS
jgi:hypothetical protein